MKQVFDIAHQIRLLESPSGLIRLFKKDIRQAIDERTLRRSINSFVIEAIRCILCNRVKDTDWLLEKADIWMKEAILTGEKHDILRNLPTNFTIISTR